MNEVVICKFLLQYYKLTKELTFCGVYLDAQLHTTTTLIVNLRMV